MASVTEPRPAPAAGGARADERLVDEQIKRTRRALKVVDLTAGMITLVIGVIMFLLAAAVLEHWVIPGGWSIAARSVLFVLLVLGAAYYSFRVIWPLLRQPINAAYAAQAIEQSSPALKNSLLNFLLLRNRKQLISRQVFQAIEHQAAQGISKISLDSVIDRSAILRLGYVLLAVVAVCAIYLLFSPKDLVTSAGRVLLPWSNVAVPSRVQLHNITPGETQVARGDQLEISAEVLGLSEDEPVRLLYSTSDKQIVGQEILMSTAAEGILFEAKLPGRMSEAGGVQQDFSYWIEAGDARSQHYQVTVFARPTLVVQSVQYNYPDYTGYPSREEEHTGDISAVEGTVVTITAISNQLIQSGHVDFESNGRRDLLMKVEDRQATISFPLELREDRRTPRYQSYMLRYTTTEGRKNKLPPKYQIDVTPDYSPEIRLLAPEEEVVDVMIDEQVTIEVEARDPDFAVRNVSILGEVGGEQVLKESLLSKNHTGRFVGRMKLTPSKLGLKVGDVLQYWGAAADNRRPKANLAFTNRRKIRVVGPDEENQQKSDKQGDGEPESAGGGEPSKSDEESAEKSDEGGEGESNDSEEGSEGEGQQGQGQSGAGEEGEGMSDEQDQQQGGEGQAGDSNEENQESQAESDGQAGGDSEGDQENNESTGNEAGDSEGDSSDGERGNEQEKISPDGDDDGTAFERIADHLDEQEKEEAGEPSEMNEQAGGEGKQQPRESDTDAADGKADADQSDHGADGEAAEADEQGESDAADGEPQEPGDKGADAEGDSTEGDSTEGKPEEGDAQEGEQQGEEQDPAGSEQAGEQKPGDQEADKQKGAPNPEDENAAQKKQGEQEAQGEPGDQEADSESQDQSKSDTQGSDGGDRSGEGDKGSGQESEGSGTGSEGEHQAADEGGGEADQPGEGNKSGEPGDKQKAEGETGESSKDQPGNGSEQGGKSGEQSGDENQGEKSDSQGDEGQSKQGADGEKSSQDGEPQESTEGENPSAPAGQQPSGNGQNGDSSPPPKGETQAGDEANLDYARKQTDLILDKLDDQLKKKETDQELLKKLGWSKEELRRFVDRWKNLKQADGKDASAAEQQELDDALRSLGLGRNRRTGFQSKTAKDKLRELQDSYRGNTPLRYQQRVRAYIKGTAAADEE